MPEISFHSPEYYPGCGLRYVIIGARYLDRWVFIKHRRRKGYELPAGHIMRNENPDRAAARELREETGAGGFNITCIATYTVSEDDELRAGRLYYADIIEIGTSRDDSEVEDVIYSDQLPAKLSFPHVQKVLFEYLLQYFRDQRYSR